MTLGTPAGAAIDPALARRIRWVGFDVDGVLTDGGVYLGDADGRRLEFKRYDIQDGLGVLLLRMAGLKVGIVTGRVSESVRLRAAELGADDLVQDPRARKLPALRAVGLGVVVDNATDEAARAGALRLTRRGGAGAVREFAELLLRARGEWEALVERYLADRLEALDPEPAGAAP